MIAEIQSCYPGTFTRKLCRGEPFHSARGRSNAAAAGTGLPNDELVEILRDSPDELKRVVQPLTRLLHRCDKMGEIQGELLKVTRTAMLMFAPHPIG